MSHDRRPLAFKATNGRSVLFFAGLLLSNPSYGLFRIVRGASAEVQAMLFQLV